MDWKEREREQPKKGSKRYRASREKRERDSERTRKIGRTRPIQKKCATRVRERRKGKLSLIWVFSHTKPQKNSKAFFINNHFILTLVYYSMLF